MSYTTMKTEETMSESIIIEDFRRNADVKRKRRQLLTMLYIFLIILIAILLAEILLKDSDENTSCVHLRKIERLESFLELPKEIILYIIFIIMVTKYNRTGILVFGWLTIIDLITAPIEIIIESIKTAREFSSASQGEKLTFMITIFVIVAIVLIIFLIFITILAFKLAKLIKQSHSQSVI